MELGGRRIFASHFPHYGRGIACAGDYGLVCFGHSHVADPSAQYQGRTTLLVNPGSVSGVGAPNADEAFTWILGDLADMTFEVHTLKH